MNGYLGVVLAFVAVVALVALGLRYYERTRKKGHTPAAPKRGAKDWYDEHGRAHDWMTDAPPADRRIDYSTGGNGPTAAEKKAKGGR